MGRAAHVLLATGSTEFVFPACNRVHTLTDTRGRVFGLFAVIDDLLQAAQDPSQRSAELCRLYIDRCYRLFDEDYATLKSLDEAIQRLESPTGE